MKFNFFTILSKDDKELIHSSFIRFLLQDASTSEFVVSNLFPAFSDLLNRDSIALEKVYNYKITDEKGKKKGKRIRIDLHAESDNGQSLLIIENKFKSFPYIEQLEIYDERLQESHGVKNIVKYLLCFDKDIIPFEKENWHFISYQDLLRTLNQLLENVELEPDKRLFIKHYIDFLSEYFSQYERVKESCGYLFSDTRNDNNKFWIRLINAMARLKLQEYFKGKNITVAFVVNPGNTNVPLINIIPSHWNRSNETEI